MGTRSEDRYAAALEDLADEDAARRFLRRSSYSDEDIERLAGIVLENVASPKQRFEATERAIARLSPERRAAFDAAMDRELALGHPLMREQRHSQVPEHGPGSLGHFLVRENRRKAFHASRTRVLAQARGLRTEIEKLWRLLESSPYRPAEAEGPESDPELRALAKLAGGPASSSSDPKSQALAMVRHAFAIDCFLGIPVGITFAEVPLRETHEALVRLDANLSVGADRGKPRRTRAKKRESQSLPWLSVLLVSNPSLAVTGKMLAALECLAMGSYPRSQISAARCCKQWDTALTRARPKAQEEIRKMMVLREIVGRTKATPST